MNFSLKKPRLMIPVKFEQTVYVMPLWQKLAICVVTFSIPLIAFWFLFLASRIEEFSSISKKIPKLRQEVMLLQQKAKKVPEFEAELKELNRIFKKAMRLLPESKDIPAMLTEISSIGNEEHLEFLSFQPGAEIKKDFYAEIPINLVIEGPFHNTMRFFDKVSHMSRIVHIKNVSMGNAREKRETWSEAARTPSPSGTTSGAGASKTPMKTVNRGTSWVISTKCTAVTYRFLTEKEQQAQGKKKGGKKGGRG